MKSISVLVISVLASLAVSLGWGVALVRLDARAPAQTAECALPSRALVRRELVFGTVRAHAAPLGEDEWQSFLDSVVTPRFPDGLTVLNALGQWRGEGGLTREQSRILVIWYDRSPGAGCRHRSHSHRLQDALRPGKRPEHRQRLVRVVLTPAPKCIGDDESFPCHA